MGIVRNWNAGTVDETGNTVRQRKETLLGLEDDLAATAVAWTWSGDAATAARYEIQRLMTQAGEIDRALAEVRAKAAAASREELADLVAQAVTNGETVVIPERGIVSAARSACHKWPANVGRRHHPGAAGTESPISPAAGEATLED